MNYGTPVPNLERPFRSSKFWNGSSQFGTAVPTSRIATSPQATPPRRVIPPRRSSPRRPPRLASTSRRASPRRLAAAPSLTALPSCLAVAPRRRNLHRCLAAVPSRLARSRLATSPPSTPPCLAAISLHPPNGGASGMLTTCIIQPIDMIKVRIQLGQGSAAQVTTTMLKNEGVAAFYKGLSAGLLRQATYTTSRLGSFKILTSKAIEANDGKPLPLYQKALCGLTAGAIGAYYFDFLAWNCLFSNDVDCLKLIMNYEKGTSGRTRLVVVATHKFVAEVAGDAL
ncbi:hypothetical protein Fmac_001454 [Flemingia macrophylla]|uniref:Uncharacterized protein n=1 Tax=Flemingia macrophylla TaxID=520843 RepID=A0ABD1NH61_9FABA